MFFKGHSSAWHGSASNIYNVLIVHILIYLYVIVLSHKVFCTIQPIHMILARPQALSFGRRVAYIDPVLRTRTSIRTVSISRRSRRDIRRHLAATRNPAGRYGNTRRDGTCRNIYILYPHNSCHILTV